MGLMSLGESCVEMQGDIGTWRGEGHGKTGAEMGAMHLQAKPEGHGGPQELLERLSQPPEATNPADTVISDLQPPDSSDSNFVWFKLPSLLYLFAAAPGN